MFVHMSSRGPYVQVPIGSDFPVWLCLLLETQEVAFVIGVPEFKAIFDMSTDKVDAYFDEDGFAIGTTTYGYNTPYEYKEIPDMLKWLQKQNLVMNF